MSTPIEIDKELCQLIDEIDKWDKLLCWFEAKRDFYKTQLDLADAEAQIAWTGVAGKAKAYGITQTRDERIALDIAKAELSMCEHRMHSLEKKSFLLMGRNKNALAGYAVGGH